jgi:hypothetical protein
MNWVRGCLSLVVLMNLALPAGAQNQKSEVAKSAPSAGKPAGAAPGEGAQDSQELVLVPKRDGKEPADYRFRLGERLAVRAVGPVAKKIRSVYATNANTKALMLHLEGVPMPGLPMDLTESRTGGDLLLLIQLSRDSSNDDNRKAWDRLLKNQATYTFTPAIALAVGSDPSVTIATKPQFQLYVVSSSELAWTAVGGLVIFLVGYFVLTRSSTMLRDAKNASYSLGKSQMAFWGLLVLLTFVGVVLMTDSMERVPPQVLILLGLSGATGLGAVVIGESKKAGTKADIAALENEKQRLEAEKLANAAGFPQTSQARLTQLDAELAQLRQALEPAPSEGFWRDICSDGNGLSFHRLQVVLWTLVLGAIFVWSVTQVISMPEFSETLLILLGISNGTYLGFKFPERT